MTEDVRRWRSVLLRVLIAAGVLWGGWKGFEAWYYWKTVARIEDEIESGLVSRAAKDLLDLSELYPDSDQVAFLVGNCEKARGRGQAAAEAWARIPRTSRFAFPATEGRVEVDVEQGRLTEAEQLINSVREDPQYNGPDASILLGAIYSREGRLPEAMKLIEALWLRHHESGQAASETAINQLWLYIQLRSNPVPDETVRAVLKQAGTIAPDDDRIWLWKANLAIRARSYDQAARWIDRCLARRPEDPAVWRARLDWAVATQRVPAAREALKHLPAAGWDPAEVETLAAWFAAHRGDDEAERTSLERLIAVDPCDFIAVDRLVALRLKIGQPELASALRQRREEIIRLQARYDTLIKRRQPRRDAAELGRLAAQLGRRFEARAFLTIALASGRDRPAVQRDLARLARSSERSAVSARTLNEQLAPQRDGNAEKASRSPQPAAHSR